MLEIVPKFDIREVDCALVCVWMSFFFGMKVGKSVVVPSKN